MYFESTVPGAPLVDRQTALYVCDIILYLRDERLFLYLRDHLNIRTPKRRALVFFFFF